MAKLFLEWEDEDLNSPDKKCVTPLWLAASEGHEGLAKMLLGQQDVDHNCPEKGVTPLGCATINGHEGTVKQLVGQQDVDHNLADMDDETPLRYAAILEH